MKVDNIRNPCDVYVLGRGQLLVTIVILQNTREGKVEGCGPKLFIENEDFVSLLHRLTLHSVTFALMH